MQRSTYIPRLSLYWPAIFAGLFVLCGLLLAFYPIDTWKNNLRDFGSAIAGIWALAAALLALFTVFWSSERQNEMQTKAYQRRKCEVASVCLAESQAMWQFFDDLKVIDALKDSNYKLDFHKDLNHALHVNVNNGWLPLLSVNRKQLQYLEKSMILHRGLSNITTKLSTLLDA